MTDPLAAVLDRIDLQLLGATDTELSLLAAVLGIDASELLKAAA